MPASAYLKLIRPLNSVMIGFAVLVGATVASSGFPVRTSSLFGFLTGFAVTAYSMVINDIFDEKVDRANRSSRPIATGQIRASRARWYAAAYLVVGLGSSALTGWLTLLIAAAFALLSTLYNWKLKESGLPGNMAVALSMTIPFIYGGLLVGVLIHPLLDAMALTAFFAGVGREVIKGITDVEGDAVRNVRSIARVRGARVASMVGAGLFLVAVLTSQIPALLGRVGIPYITLIAVTDVIFILLSAAILRDSNNAGRVKTGALFGMLLGLFGFILQGLLP
jgi:geranylgeranylglycerol-phosphate geranylgeranyltransferase